MFGICLGALASSYQAVTPTYDILDTFTDADGTDLSAHTADIGGAWSKAGSGFIKINNNRIYGSGSYALSYYLLNAAPTPPTDEYDITFDLLLYGSNTNQDVAVGVYFRFNLFVGAYLLKFYDRALSGGTVAALLLYNTANTLIGTYTPTWGNHTVKIQVRDAFKGLCIDGGSDVFGGTITDNDPTTGAGKVGLYSVGGADTNGYVEIDNFRVTYL